VPREGLVVKESDLPLFFRNISCSIMISTKYNLEGDSKTGIATRKFRTLLKPHHDQKEAATSQGDVELSLSESRRL